MRKKNIVYSMCLYPKLIPNPKYRSNKKNGGVIPECQDERVKWVPVGCGQCFECRRKKRNEWMNRLLYEFGKDNECCFVTLTFSEENLEILCKEFGVTESNFIATKAVRRFLERWRKLTKKSVKHWLITELGHQNTERIHLHGILWTNKDKDFIEKVWSYGMIYVGEFCNEKTINYIVKYITKLDFDHKGYNPIILCSSGIGKGYEKSNQAGWNKYKPNGQTDESYRLKNGQRTGLPVYWRNKIYSEEERELLWIEKLNRQERWVDKIKIDVSESDENYYKVLEIAREKNKRLRYGDDSKEWQKKDYNVTVNILKKLTDIALEKSNPAEFYRRQAEKVKAYEKRQKVKKS